jgi:hypothetical protein
MTATLAPHTFTALDRCDRCGAQAFVRAVLPSGSDLVFCAHHGRQYEAGLIAARAIIRDDSGVLDA